MELSFKDVQEQSYLKTEKFFPVSARKYSETPVLIMKIKKKKHKQENDHHLSQAKSASK